MPTTIEDRLRSYAATLDAAATDRALCHRNRQPSPAAVTQTEEVLVLDARTPAPGRRRVTLVAACLAIVVAAGVGLFLIAGPRREREAVPGDDGGPSTRATNPVSWTTEQVHLTADDFRIDVNGTEFVADDPAIEVQSDPGDPHYQTLELTWTEHGVEMRWYVYFQSDGVEWWSDEMRTYDGNAAGEWVTFTGDFFRSPLGHAYSGELDVTAADHGVTSHLRVAGLTLAAFRDTVE